MSKVKLAILGVVLLGAVGGGIYGGLLLHERKTMAEDEKKLKEMGVTRKFEYVKLAKTLNVPLLENNKTVAVLLADVVIEGTEGIREELQQKEPLLRNNLLQVLYLHATRGSFREKLLSERVQADLRYDMTEEAKKIFGTKVNAVLLNDFQRQESN